MGRETLSATDVGVEEAAGCLGLWPVRGDASWGPLSGANAGGAETTDGDAAKDRGVGETCGLFDPWASARGCAAGTIGGCIKVFEENTTGWLWETTGGALELLGEDIEGGVPSPAGVPSTDEGPENLGLWPWTV